MLSSPQKDIPILQDFSAKNMKSQRFTYKIDNYQIKQYEQTQRQKQQKQISRNEGNEYRKSRAGNNCAQNIKKCFISIIRNKISKQNMNIFQKECIIQHKIKSQKTNFIIISLYLHKMFVKRLISRSTLEQVILTFKEKLQKYADNSKARAFEESFRAQFHDKTAEEFQKYVNFDIDFTSSKSFQRIGIEMQKFYKKKNMEYRRGLNTFFQVIQKDKLLIQFFNDIKIPSTSDIKEQQKFILQFDK